MTSPRALKERAAREAARAAQLLQRGHALQAAAQSSHGISVNPWYGIVALLGLECDGLLKQLAERDQLGGRRFVLTEAGRAVAKALAL